MIKEAIDRILGLAPPTIIYEGSKKIVIGHDGKVTILRDADDAFYPQTDTGTVASFCDHIKRYFHAEKTSVSIGTKGCVAYMDVDGSNHNKSRIGLPFFDVDLPTEDPMTHEEFLDYLDQHVPEGDTLTEVMRSITISENETVKCVETGANIAIEIAGKKNIQGATSVIPKFITLKLRRGTREYVMEHRFRLHVKDTAGKQLMFRLVHLNRDGAEDQFLATCKADVTRLLGEGWHIIQGV